MYGSTNQGKQIFFDQEVHDKLRPLAERLNVAERVVTPSGVSGTPDEWAGVGPEGGDKPVSLFGAVEHKAIRGADTRLYVCVQRYCYVCVVLF